MTEKKSAYVISEIKVGDLVDFDTASWVMRQPDYFQRNPGIVIDSRENKHMVLWSDQSSTIEHSCYLRVINENR